MSEQPRPQAFLQKLRKRRIIETLAAFIAGGWLLIEIVERLLVGRYGFPVETIDLAVVSVVGAAISTLIWRWFRSSEKRPGNVKIEVLVAPLVVLATTAIDLNIIFRITGISDAALPVAVIAFCLGIAWVILKLSQWASAVPASGTKEAEASPPTFARPEKSIVVLPFTDLSPQKDQEYFCDGMTEEIINRLSNIKELKVTARTSSFIFKGKADDIRQIGQNLNVRTVLEGSIRKVEDRIRITVQLVDATDGYHIWSESYDRELRGIFAIQDEIALAVADKLKLTLLGGERAGLVRRSTENLEAYNLYLLGLHHFHKMTEADLKKSIGYLEDSIKKEPSNAPAYSAMSACYFMLCGNGYLSPADGYPKAKKAARQALDLDDSIGEAHASLAFAMFIFDWDLSGAEKEFRRALDLSPRSADILGFYSWFLGLSGRFEEAISGFKQAIDLDPVSPFAGSNLGWAYYYARRYDESITQLKTTLLLDPNNYFTLMELAWNYAIKRMRRDLETVVDKIRSLYPLDDDPLLLFNISTRYALVGEKEKARDLLEKLLRLSAMRYVDPYDLASVYAALGERERVFEYLAKGLDLRSSHMVFTGVDPVYDSVRSDARYDTLLKKLGWTKGQFTRV